VERTAVRLPTQPTSFVGRGAELDTLAALLNSSRLVTIAGAAGMGKTRLAIELAGRFVGLADVEFVGLAALADGRFLAHEVAARLGAAERAGELVERTLIGHVGTRPTLLLLDNCEHLVADCASLVDALLRGCAELRVLATSRQPLRVPGEVLWRIGPLSLPGRHGLEDSEAVRLFEARARQVSPTWSIEPGNAGAVADLCRRLDGIPLAIELAASRMETLSVAEVLERLGDRLHLLAAERAGEGRHRTLQAALDWGYQLLDGPERLLFRRLSVFAGSFELSTAEAVCSDARLEAQDIEGLVFRLVEHSLLQLTATAGPTTYRLLEPVRQSGSERLAESGEQDAVAERHAAWFLAVACQAEEGERGQDQRDWLERLDANRDDFRAALGWCCGHDSDAALTMGSALSWYWVTRGHFAEGRGWLEDVLATAPTDATGRARGMVAAARLSFYQGDYDAARRLCEAGLALLHGPGEDADRGWALTVLAWVHGYEGEQERAVERFEEAIAATEDELVRAEALVALGELLLQMGDLARARPHLEEVARLGRGPEAPRARAMLMLGLRALLRGDRETAEAELGRSLDAFQRLGNGYGVAGTLDVLAGVAVRNADPVRALRLTGAADALRESTRSQLAPRWQEMVRVSVVEPAFAAAGVRAAAAWAAGREMTFDEAVRYARSGLIRSPEPRQSTTAPTRRRSPAGLTARELEVAQMVAQRLTNREIAQRLLIAERTVEGHVERIRAKLNIHSRAQIADAIVEGAADV
jgi:predicted ATPase/DNA-binding CsgD family transcriptional regulator